MTKYTQINNRRYLGNKYKLLPFIKNVVNDECKDIEVFADIFSGTGAVSSAFADKQLITNDLLYSNYICNVAWFDSEYVSIKKISHIIEKFNSEEISEENYMTRNFSDTYFSRSDCSKIGFVREQIEIMFREKEINFRERAVLITSLLYAMDKIAKTVGHYDAFFQKSIFDKNLYLLVPHVKNNLNKKNKCFNLDANELVSKISADLVYIDPPYNSRQYSDAYHLLENVAKWEKPEVFGIAKKMNRSKLKSKYCTNQATQSFEELVNQIDSKYILLSFNNMSLKGNNRSNAKISDIDIMRILSKKGEVTIFTEDYKAFSTGKSNIKDNKERLFLCKCFVKPIRNTQSPLNYSGGKYKLLDQIYPYFPKRTDYFVDLMCGGCNVGINVNSSKILLNDKNENLIGLLKTLKENDKQFSLTKIDSIIEKYNLSRSSKFGYEFYGCNSGDGLSSYNKEKFYDLREKFNSFEVKNDDYYYLLFVLIVYSFNNQLRFNRNGFFNLPVGKRDFNPKMEDKLSRFIDRIKTINCEFTSQDYKDLNLGMLTSESLVYIDPPYLITCATYNEQNGWNESHEVSLLEYLDSLNHRGVKFALSNVIENKGKNNAILKKWLNDNPNYHVHYLDKNYANSNYQIKDKSSKTIEVLITNFTV